MDDHGQQLDLIDVPPIATAPPAADVPPGDPPASSASAERTRDAGTRARAQTLAREWWYPMKKAHGSIENCMHAIGVALAEEGLSLARSDLLTEAFDAAAWALARTSWDKGSTQVTEVARQVIGIMRRQIGLAPSERRVMTLAIETLSDYRQAQAEKPLEPGAGGSDDRV